MKLSVTKTEEIDIDLEELPDEIYAELVPQICKELNVWLWEDGTISCTHEWDREDAYIKSEKLSDLAREAVLRKPTKNELETMLFEIRAAEKIILEAMQ